jgi:hypothetical protein
LKKIQISLNFRFDFEFIFLREGAGGKPARAEAAGDAAAKKRACKLFLPPRPQRLATADLEPKTDPERSEGARPD